MKKFLYDTDDCIAALATPWGKSALAVIRVSGNGSIGLLAPLFQGVDLTTAVPAKMHRGWLANPQAGERIDEVMIACFHAPRSFTGQESAEIYCHGSLAGIKLILKLLFCSGFRQASPGEFSYRAFASGKIDLTRAEAIQEIVGARTKRAQEMALSRLSGSIEQEINRIKDGILKISAHISIQLDYPEDEVDAGSLPREDIEAFQSDLQKLAESYHRGKLYQEGLRVALSGRTNAGKSSLFNLLLKEERSIVSDYHGTTRDFVEGGISLGGIPLRLYDTAGFRDAEHPVEQEGIRRSSQIVEKADIVLYLVDGMEGLHDEDQEFILKQSPDRLICLWNKADLDPPPPPEGFIPVSGIDPRGLVLLEEELLRRAGISSGEETGAVIDSERQRDRLLEASDALDRLLSGIEEGMPLDILVIDVQEALHALGEITGEIVSTDILHRMFSEFCVGK